MEESMVGITFNLNCPLGPMFISFVSFSKVHVYFVKFEYLYKWDTFEYTLKGLSLIHRLTTVSANLSVSCDTALMEA